MGLLKRELAELLGCSVPELPAVFRGARPKILTTGIHEEFEERYPLADQKRIRDWLQRWTAMRSYQHRMMHANNRHNLDRKDRGSICQADRDHAFKMLYGWRRKQTQTSNEEAHA